MKTHTIDSLVMAALAKLARENLSERGYEVPVTTVFVAREVAGHSVGQVAASLRRLLVANKVVKSGMGRSRWRLWSAKDAAAHAAHERQGALAARVETELVRRGLTDEQAQAANWCGTFRLETETLARLLGLVEVATCSVCGKSAHASETDDSDRCADCAKPADDDDDDDCELPEAARKMWA